MTGKIFRLLLFVAVAGGVLVAIGAEIANVERGDRYELEASFDDVTGLLVGDEVKLAGVPVGQVSSVGVDQGRAVVRFTVRDGVRLAPDTEVAVRWRNLIGQRYLYLYPGPGEGEVVDGERLERVRDVTDLGALVDGLGPLAEAIDADQLNQIFDALSIALDGREAEVPVLVDDLRQVVAVLSERDETIAQLLGDYEVIAGTLARRDGQVQAMIDNLLALTTTLADNRALVERAVTDLGGFSGDVDALLAANGDAFAAVVDDLADVGSTVRGELAALESTILALPRSSAELFAASSYGEFLRLDINCLALNEPPCPLPLLQPADSSTEGPGHGGPDGTTLSSPGSFRRLLVGEATP